MHAETFSRAFKIRIIIVTIKSIYKVYYTYTSTTVRNDTPALEASSPSYHAHLSAFPENYTRVIQLLSLMAVPFVSEHTILYAAQWPGTYNTRFMRGEKCIDATLPEVLSGAFETTTTLRRHDAFTLVFLTLVSRTLLSLSPSLSRVFWKTKRKNSDRFQTPSDEKNTIRFYGDVFFYST